MGLQTRQVPINYALDQVQRDDPSSYALVQNLLASPSAVFAVEESEARAMDEPNRRATVAEKPRRWQKSDDFAGVQTARAAPRTVHHRKEGLVALPAFTQTVEAIAGIPSGMSSYASRSRPAKVKTNLMSESPSQAAEQNPLMMAAKEYV